MANKKFWLVILAMVLVFGMTVVGCDLDAFGSSAIGNSITGNPKVGETLTVTIKGDFWDYTIWWEHADSPDSTWMYYVLTPVTRPSLTLHDGYLGKYIRVNLFSYRHAEDFYSNVIGPVQP